MELKRAIIEYALARDAMYRAVKACDDQALDAAVVRMRRIGELLWEIGHRLAREEEAFEIAPAS